MVTYWWRYCRNICKTNIYSFEYLSNERISNSNFYRRHLEINTLVILLYFHRTCRRTRTVPYFDKIFETKYSKTIRQKFKVNIFSDRVKLALSGSYFSFIFCRIVFENFDKENWFRYGTDTVRRQIRWKYSINIVFYFTM